MRPFAALRRAFRGGPRSGLTGLLLAFSVLATAALAMQAHAAHTYHRATAERLLRDLAGLAGHEMVRRATAHLGYEGYYTLLTAAAPRVRLAMSPPALATELAAHPEPRVRAAAPLARRFFVVAGDRVPVFTPDQPPLPVVAWVRERLSVGLPRGEPFAVVHGTIDGRPHSLVLTRLRDGGRWEVLGFEVELAALAPWLAAVLANGSLLPTVGRGRVTNEALSVVVRDHGGVERFRSGPASAPFASVVPFGDTYSGVLAGSTVEVALGPQAARMLVTGGMPRSRLPLLLGLLVLSAGLVVAALLQLRRERALQRLRAEFVASVSHELRTPLTQIRMFAETLLLDRVRSPEERRRALEIVDREARRLGTLVENVLLFARSERGVPPPAPTRQPLAPLVREVLEQFAPVAAGGGARVVAALDEHAAAEVDGDGLRQVLLNLVDNAVKYGPAAQELRVALEAGDRLVRLAVEDEGPGVPATERSRVFAPFQRLERDRRSAVAGMGIGLALVAEFAARHGGRAFVEDGTRGGARFVVELPA